jgi:hypothetical protein
MTWRHFPIQDKWIPKKMEGLIDLVEFVIEKLQAGILTMEVKFNYIISFYNFIL